MIHLSRSATPAGRNLCGETRGIKRVVMKGKVDGVRGEAAALGDQRRTARAFELLAGDFTVCESVREFHGFLLALSSQPIPDAPTACDRKQSELPVTDFLLPPVQHDERVFARAPLGFFH